MVAQQNGISPHGGSCRPQNRMSGEPPPNSVRQHFCCRKTVPSNTKPWGQSPSPYGFCRPQVRALAAGRTWTRSRAPSSIRGTAPSCGPATRTATSPTRTTCLRSMASGLWSRALLRRYARLPPYLDCNVIRHIAQHCYFVAHVKNASTLPVL